MSAPFVTPLNIQGHVAPGFEKIEDRFKALWEEIEVGASLCVFVGNEPVVNLWGGYRDRDQTQPWQQDTLVNLYSATKGIVALALATLADEGRLDYNAKVVDYWPQFGAERKYDITVAQLLSHQAGLYQFEPAVTVTDLYQWQHMIFHLASQKPAWEPGSAFGYHAITWGYLAGELIRQITGLTPGSFIQERLAGPLYADVYLGLPASMHDRCATLIGPNHARKKLPTRDFSSEKALTSNDPLITPYRDASSRQWREAEIPATNGHASAEGLALCYKAALSGELVSKSALATATTELTHGEIDLALGQPLRRAMGFILNCQGCYFGPAKSAFGHSGTGGSIAFADPENGVAFAYVMNQLHSNGPVRSRQLVDSLYQCL